MAAAGNFCRNNYEDVTPRRAWKALQEDLSPLGAVIQQELGSRVTVVPTRSSDGAGRATASKSSAKNT